MKLCGRSLLRSSTSISRSCYGRTEIGVRARIIGVALEFLAWLYNKSPVKDTVVVNDRWGQGTTCKHGGYLTCGDRYHPEVTQSRKWEFAMTLDNFSWGYRRNSKFSELLTTQDLISSIVSSVAFRGKYPD